MHINKEENLITTHTNLDPDYVKSQEIRLALLQTELHDKISQLASKQEEVDQFWDDLYNLIAQQLSSSSSSTAQRSATTRMQEEQEKQKILADWRLSNPSSSNDPLFQSRQLIMAIQKEISSLNMQIASIKQELMVQEQMQSSNNSAYQRMQDERHKQQQIPKHHHIDEIRRSSNDVSGSSSNQLDNIPPPILRSHQQRMAEQLACKIKAKNHHLSN